MANVERLRALAARILEVERGRDDDRVGFGMLSYYDTSCGTTACIAGHAILMFGDAAEIENLVNYGGMAFQDALEILGLDEEVAQDLFYDFGLDTATAARRLMAIADEAEGAGVAREPALT